MPGFGAGTLVSGPFTMMLEENTVVAGRFRLIRMIGRGGMGFVWRAFGTRLDIACALEGHRG